MPIAGFIVDFACVDAGLVVEVDGGQHDQMRAIDAARTHTIEAAGYSVIRFWNNDVLSNIGAVITAIDKSLNAR